MDRESLENPALNEYLRIRKELTAACLLKKGRKGHLSQNEAISELHRHRKRCFLEFGWGNYSLAELQFILKYGPFLEVGAGLGYLTWLLRQLDGDILAFDIQPDPSQNKWCSPGAKPWTEVHQGDEEVVLQHPERTPLLAFPVNDLGFKVLSRTKAKTFVYVDMDGVAPKADFADLLYGEWTCTDGTILPSWSQIESHLEAGTRPTDDRELRQERAVGRWQAVARVFARDPNPQVSNPAAKAIRRRIAQFLGHAPPELLELLGGQAQK